MGDEDGCVSRFFKGGSKTFTLIPKRTPASPNHSFNSSQDISQSSIDSETNILSVSQLSVDEKEPLNIPYFYNISPRFMPVSPHYIIEEEFVTNPWALLIATIFLNKTSGKTARPYIKRFFERYPTPYHVLEVNPISFERFFDHLGLRKRGPMIWKMTHQFVFGKWRRASDLCGIGKYGEDAYRIFCLGQTDLDPEDRFLKLYLDWLRGTDFIEDNAVETVNV